MKYTFVKFRDDVQKALNEKPEKYTEAFIKQVFEDTYKQFCKDLETGVATFGLPPGDHEND
jgi:hypothetical protein